MAATSDKPLVLIPCSVLSIHDADTITVDVLFPWGIELNAQSVRLLGFDAWEVNRTRRTVELTERELERGKAARDALERLVSASESAYLRPDEEGRRDPYGRLPAYLYLWDAERARLIDVAEWMRRNGYDRTAE